MTSGDFGDSGYRRVGMLQCRTSPVQSSQQEISRGAYAEESGATHPQATLRYADVRTQSRHFQFLIDTFAAWAFLETTHDEGVMVSCRGVVVDLVGGQAIDDRVKHFLLQRPCHLGALDQFLFGFRKMASIFKETLKP